MTNHSNLDENVSCMLCTNFLVDAVTLTECLHFFCRRCLLRYLKKENRCPKCFQDLGPDLEAAFRRDHLLQRFVYKLVPELYWRELQRRTKREAVLARRSSRGISKRRANKTREMIGWANKICRSDEKVSLVVEYASVAQIAKAYQSRAKSEQSDIKEQATSSSDIHNSATNFGNKNYSTFQRYFRCPAATKIEHLRKLMELKLAMSEIYTIYFIDSALHNIFEDDLSIQDLISLTCWDRNAPFRIVFTLVRTLVVDEDKPPVLDAEEMVPRNAMRRFSSKEEFSPISENIRTPLNTSGTELSSCLVKQEGNNANDAPPPMDSMIPRLSITLSTNALTGRNTPGAYHPIITTMQSVQSSTVSGGASGTLKNKSAAVRKRRKNSADASADEIVKAKQKPGRKSNSTITTTAATTSLMATTAATSTITTTADTATVTTSISTTTLPISAYSATAAYDSPIATTSAALTTKMTTENVQQQKQQQKFTTSTVHKPTTNIVKDMVAGNSKSDTVKNSIQQSKQQQLQQQQQQNKASTTESKQQKKQQQAQLATRNRNASIESKNLNCASNSYISTPKSSNGTKIQQNSGQYTMPASSLDFMAMNALFNPMAQISPSSFCSFSTPNLTPTLNASNGVNSPLNSMTMFNSVFPVQNSSPASVTSYNSMAEAFSQLSPQQQQQQMTMWYTLLKSKTDPLFAYSNGLLPQQLAAGATQMNLPFYSGPNPLFANYLCKLASGGTMNDFSTGVEGQQERTSGEHRCANGVSKQSPTNNCDVVAALQQQRTSSPTKKSRKDGPVQKLNADGIPVVKKSKIGKTPASVVENSNNMAPQKNEQQRQQIQQQQKQQQQEQQHKEQQQKTVAKNTETVKDDFQKEKLNEKGTTVLQQQQKKEQQQHKPQQQQKPQQQISKQSSTNGYSLDASHLLSTMVSSASSLISSAATVNATVATSQPTLAN